MKNQLLKRLSAHQFAMFEFRLFLDTHPDDEEALKRYNEHQKQYEAIKKEYEEQFGPLTLNGYNSDDWLQNPWPWD
jgi:spore coat protein JB